MRNLKKILALVLALIMSLSLMATAGATDFKDDESIDSYQLAIEVLSGLKVFGGDQNGNFNPKDPIRRSEVAAIIYRIATGDVSGENHKTYGLYNQFKDVQDGDWFAGYVSYCHNAGYIKGHGDGNFKPYDNVTGYQALAMILRAVGYDKNNEFTGDNWQINTASIATQRGVLKGVKSTEDLKVDATRELVAEILFRSILLDKVQWNALTHSYDTTNEQVCDVIGLEEIEGVVMANQWADLEKSSVMADGKTRMKVSGKDYTLDYATELTDIGESRIAYVKGADVFSMEDTGDNVRKDNEGKKTTLTALRDGLSVTDAEYFINFSDVEVDKSEWLIRYNVTIDTLDANGNVVPAPWYQYNGQLTAYGEYLNRGLNGEDDDYALYTQLTASSKRNATVAERSVTNSGKTFRVLTVTLQPGAVINSFDQYLMQRIFYTADRFASNPTTNTTGIPTTVGVDYYVLGEVYAGTTSLEDKSDIMSWNQFVDTYLTSNKVKDITGTGNGNWLKVIDNNNDGKAEYVLLTNYTLDKVVNSATKNDTTTFYYKALDIEANKPVYLDGYEPAVGDVVLYAVIDGTAQMKKAETATASFKAVSYKDETATDSEGTVWTQSHIINRTDMPDILPNVDENVSYTLYLDKYGYVRAYDNKTTYALVTEVYPTNSMNQAWLTSRALTAEVMTAEDGVVREYNLVNSYPGNRWNPFFIGETNSWTSPVNNVRRNYLTHAANGLGYKNNAPFNYGSNNAHTPYSWTNVAKYTLTDNNGINLTTAADYNGNTVSEDYIRLKVANVSPNNPLYEIEDTTWNDPDDKSVRAVDDTEFFIVASTDNVIKHFTGYTKIPALTVAGNGIRAMYAVAEKTRANVGNDDYWVANVIVIEMDHFTNAFDSVALIYSNDYKISGDTKYLQAIDSKKGEIGIIPNNYIWQGQFANRGFYGLSNITATEDADIFRADITLISWTGDARARAAVGNPNTYQYNANGIYYGRVRSLNGELTRSSYITVDRVTGIDGNGDYTYVTETIRLAANYGSVYGINGTYPNANTALDLIMDYHANKQVQVGDEIVWVETSSTTKTAGFVVDLTDSDVNAFGTVAKRDWNPTPTWLWSEVDEVIADQVNNPASGERTAGPVVKVTAPDGTLLGEVKSSDYNNSNAYTLTIPYEKWMNYSGRKATVTVTAADKNTITVVNRPNNNAYETSKAIREDGEKVIVTSKGSLSTEQTKTYTVTINYAQLTANPTLSVKSGTYNPTWTNGDEEVTTFPDVESSTFTYNLQNPSGWSLESFMDSYTSTAAKTIWNFITHDGKTCSYDGKNYTYDGKVSETVNLRMNDVQHIEVQLLDQRGKVQKTYTTTGLSSDSNFVSIKVQAADSNAFADGMPIVTTVKKNSAFAVTVTMNSGYSIDTTKNYTGVTVSGGNNGTYTLTISTTSAVNVVLDTIKTEVVEVVTTPGTSDKVQIPENPEVEIKTTEDEDGETVKTADIPGITVETPTVSTPSGNQPLKPVLSQEDQDKGMDIVQEEDGSWTVTGVPENEDGSYTVPEIQLETEPVELPHTITLEGKTSEDAEEGSDASNARGEDAPKSGTIVYDENGGPKYVDARYQSETAPQLTEAELAAGMAVYDEGGNKVERAAIRNWTIRIPVTDATITLGVVTTNNNGQITKITVTIVKDAALEEAKTAAKEALTNFVTWAKTNNGFTNEWFDNNGTLTNGQGEGANFSDVTISDEVYNSASPINGKSLTEGIAWIEEQISAAETVEEVEAIFWYDADAEGEKYSSLAWGVEKSGSEENYDAEMCSSFGYTGNLKSYIISECNLMCVKQTLINAGAGLADVTVNAKSEPQGAVDNNRANLYMAQAVSMMSLPAAKVAAKNAVDNFVDWALENNGFTNEWFDNNGTLTGSQGTGASFEDVTISDEVYNSASPINGKSLTEGIAWIKSEIDKASTVAAVKNIFWYDAAAQGEKYSSMGWGVEESGASTSPENYNRQMCIDFGYTGNLKSYIISECNLMCVKQTAITADSSKTSEILAVKINQVPSGADDNNRATLYMAAAVAAINPAPVQNENP